ncbi:MAG: Holliday junction branch migration DNA helicase RuvB [Chlamydiia bacterium]|nr:Holliday junction branch migration DNA helicase RuvB [Chlamydiia bacterium]
MTTRYTESTFTKPDRPFEAPLRPRSLQEFCGQPTVCERLGVVSQAAKERGDALGHILLSGPPGVGKTSLAHILGHEMGSQVVVTSGPVIEKAGDLAGLLTGLKKGDILFIDEIHRLSRNVEEYLYPAMEDFKLDLMIDSGPQARSVQVALEPFTLVAATTRAGLISSPLRSRFSMSLKLDYYNETVLSDILKRSSTLLGIECEPEGFLEIARRSRGTPRIANNLLRWVRDYVQVKGLKSVTLALAKEALSMLQIDEKGLDETDKRILQVMIKHYKGGPVGMSTIAAMLGEEADTLEEVHEPYLIIQDLIRRTPRGREVTEAAYRHLDTHQETL